MYVWIILVTVSSWKTVQSRTTQSIVTSSLELNTDRFYPLTWTPITDIVLTEVSARKNVRLSMAWDKSFGSSTNHSWAHETQVLIVLKQLRLDREILSIRSIVSYSGHSGWGLRKTYTNPACTLSILWLCNLNQIRWTRQRLEIVIELL